MARGVSLDTVQWFPGMSFGNEAKLSLSTLDMYINASIQRLQHNLMGCESDGDSCHQGYIERERQA